MLPAERMLQVMALSLSASAWPLARVLRSLLAHLFYDTLLKLCARVAAALDTIPLKLFSIMYVF